jgi:CubicO group peptidase (beta-lactamase class C family)
MSPNPVSTRRRYAFTTGKGSIQIAGRSGTASTTMTDHRAVNQSVKLLGMAGGSPGGGGVVTFVDPEAHIGFAYLNNASWGGTPGEDPRAGNVMSALYSCF